MTKKILTILAASLMVSGAWADVTKNNVTYAEGTPSVNSGASNSNSVKSGASIETSSDNGTINYSITKTTNHSSITKSYNLTPKSYTGTSISLENWEDNVGFDNVVGLPVETSYLITSFSNKDNVNFEYQSVNTSSAVYNNYVKAITDIKTDLESKTGAEILKGKDVSTKYNGENLVNSDGSNYGLVDYATYNIHDDLYYYVVTTEGRGGTKHKAYLIDKVYTATTENVNYINCKNIYTVTSLPTGFLTSTVTSLNIPSTVTTIADDAFQNVSASLTSITATGNFKKWNEDFLMSSDGKIIYYVTPGANGKTFSIDGVTTIKPNALQNCTGVTLNSTNASLSIGSNQGSNTINKPGVLSVVAGKVTGIVTNSNFNTWLSSATKPTESTCIDFTEAVFMENITTAFNIPDNCIIYFPAQKNNHSTLTVNTSKNAVIGGTCSNLQITDNKAWNVTKTFTADVTFNRSMPVDKWGTVMLPFELTVSGAWVGEFSGYSEGSITFTKRNTLAANTPYLFRNLGSATSFSKQGATIPVTNKSDVKFGDATFKGVYQQTTLNSGYDYAYTTNGDFIKCNGNKLNPFRAYFYITSTSSAPQMRFLDEDEQEVFFEGNANDIEAIEEVNVNETIYDLNGKQVETATAGMYIKNGKKIIIK